MKKNILSITIILLSILTFACAKEKEDINIDNNIENYIQNNNTKESYEDIVSNTVQYGSEKKQEDIETKEKRKFEKVISCQDCFHNVGFVENVCEQTGSYYFERNRNENDKYEMFDWYLYVFEERQKYKNIKEYNKPVLTNEGKIDLKKGQIHYILCSYNPDTQVLPSVSDQTYTYYMK